MTSSHKKNDFKVIVCAAILNEQNKILITRRSPDKILGGKWEFPGGKLEHGEEVEDALEREIQEELSISIKDIKLLHIKPFVYEHGACLILFYLAKHAAGTLKLIDHDQAQWCSAKEIQNFDLLPANKEVLEILKKDY